MTKDEYYLSIAQVVAKKSKCLKSKYGAVIVNGDEIVSTGYNGCCRGEPECTSCARIGKKADDADYGECPAVHAEQNAIISASRQEMIGGTLYLAGYMVNDGAMTEMSFVRPCIICFRLIKNAGISRILTSSGVEYTKNESGILVRTK